MEAAFLRQLSRASPCPPGEGLAEALAEAARRAAEAFPGVVLDDAAFAEVLAEKAARAPGQTWTERLSSLEVESLFLCAACALGDAQALGHFERRFFPGLGRLAARLSRRGVGPEELHQALRERLFVAPGKGQPPRIGGYSGQGELAGWVRVAATRVAAHLATRRRGEAPAGDALVEELPLAQTSPELDHLRRLFQTEFRAAFSRALDERTPKERLLLRQRYVDGLTVPQLAKLHGVHASTVARWQTEALDALLGALREALMTKLKLEDQELDSLMRDMRSQLDVTLRRLLSSGQRAEALSRRSRA